MPTTDSRKQPKSFVGSRLLLVEGRDEESLLPALISALNLSDIEVREYSGKRKLAAYLDTMPDIAGFANLRVIGITRDADDSAATAFQSVRDSVARVKDANGRTVFDPPVGMGRFADGMPRIGAFILPDGVNPGMLESLVMASMPDDAAFPLVDRMLSESAASTGRTNPGLGDGMKARLRAWLTTWSPPDLMMGEWARKSAPPWNFSHPCFDPLKDFLAALAAA